MKTRDKGREDSLLVETRDKGKRGLTLLVKTRDKGNRLIATNRENNSKRKQECTK